jgi:hypothetical protein
MWLRNYSVVSSGGIVVKKGSTTKSLHRRSLQHPYNSLKYAGCSLRLDKEQWWLDDDKAFGKLLLLVREQMAISAAHLWISEGGWNIAEPVQDFFIRSFSLLS